MSFTVYNNNIENTLNEVLYKHPVTKYINRGNPGQSRVLLLDEFNTIHYYHHSGSAINSFDISTGLVENGVYEIKFSCIGGTESNNDMALTPNFNDFSNSNFYMCCQRWYEDGGLYTELNGEVNSDNFYFDMFAGSFGYDPTGKITIFNNKSGKKLKVEMGDTSSVVNGTGYWLDNSGDASDYSLTANYTPPYDTTNIWDIVGNLTFNSPDFTQWHIWVSRIG